MPLKDVKRTASELPNVSTDRGNGADPNVIPETDMAILKTLGLAVGNRLKRGRYGVVFEGHFTEAFSVAKLAEAGQLTGEGSAAAAGAAVGEKSAKVELQKKPLLHYLFIRPEQKREVIACSESIKSNSSIDSNSSGGSISVSSDGNSSGGGLNDMAPGRKFGLKFCDIELRKAYHIEEVEQRLMQEINFVRRVDYTASTGAIVRHYAVFATSATRYYLLMELAEDNLQCVISAYVAANRLLPAKQVLAMYASLVAAVRSLHQQKLTYGMMRTSNILVFGQTTPLPPPTTTTTNTSSPVTPQTTAAVGKVGGKVGGQQEVSGGGVKGSTPTTSTSSSRETAPFHLKIADFVASKDASNITADAFDEAVEGDLDDLYYVHSELFTLTKLDFAQFLAFRESLKILTDFGTRRNAMDILDKVLEMVRKFALEQKE